MLKIKKYVVEKENRTSPGKTQENNLSIKN